LSDSFGDTLSITAATVDPALLDLPWSIPLEQWTAEHIAALPKGISRHVVRFANLSGYVVAVKETSEELARREYDMLRTLQRLDVPCVEPAAVISGRLDENGDALATVLVTRHLRFSLPYRALFSQTLRPETATRLADALALLLVRLHIVGFFWGDVSLSNTLFRRDAGSFAAYLVDAETGKLYPGGLSKGQRENDLEVARVNIAGELMDLAAGGHVDEDLDPLVTSERIVSQYRMLWNELMGRESFASSERWRINERVDRLNALGFDIEELSIRTGQGGNEVVIQPKVVDAGHHTRRLLRLTGLDAEENQARRLLNDLDQWRQRFGRDQMDEEMAAHEWVAGVFEPVVRSIPRDLRGKLEPAEVFHQVLEHRWFMSQRENRDVPLAEALNSYVDEILRHRRDEAALLEPLTGSVTTPIRVSQGPEDWRTLV
jgi:hypothetical protein